MRLIDANALESALTVLIFEFEHRAPKWSANDMLTSSIDAAKKYGYRADGVEAVLNVVRRMPTIDAEPVKHGHWIIDGAYQTCALCGAKDYGCVPPYCWNCGAKMDGDNNDKSGEVHN